MDIDLTVGKDTVYNWITENLFAMLNGAWHNFPNIHLLLNIYPGIVYYTEISLLQELSIQVKWNDVDIFF